VGVSAVAGATLLMRSNKLLPSYLFRAPVGLFATVYLVVSVFLAFYDKSGLVAYPSHVIAFCLGVSVPILARSMRIVRRSNQVTAPHSG
jgi:membrane associated rhomboid family serine protease